MKIRVNFQATNPVESTFDLSINDNYCEQLTIQDEDLVNFLLLLRKGLLPTDDYLERGHVYSPDEGIK